MKTTILTGLSLLAATFGASLQGRAAPPGTPDYLQDPSRVSYRGEEPRSRILSFNSRDLALQQDVANSNYIQWLDGTWKVKRFGSPVEIDPALTDPNTDTGTWSEITVPEHRVEPGWAAVYRQEFKMPFSWIDRQVFVHMGAVDRAYYLYVNGKLVGYHEDSKTGVDFDVTSFVTEGKNHLALVAYAQPASAVLENQDPAKGVAITRSVYILSQPKVRIRDYVFDAGFDARGTAGLFHFGAIVKSHLLNPKQVTVHYELLDPDGRPVISDRRDARFEMRGEDTVRFFVNIPNIQTWSHESPRLYTVVLRLQHEGRFTEYMTCRIGFRSVAFDDNGLIVNGQRVAIRGGEYTPPSSEEALRGELSGLAESGINLLRLSDYPAADLFYSLCDEYGIYVCNTANLDTHLSGDSRRVGGNPANDPAWEAAYLDRVMNMYHTSKNHPSVVLFSLGREGGNGYNAYEAYLKLRETEHTRPVIYEAAGAEWNTDMLVGKPAGRNTSDHRPGVVFATNAGAAGVPERENRIGIRAENPSAGQFRIENRYSVVNLNNFDAGYRILSGSKTVASGTLAVDVPPGEESMVTVLLDNLKPGNYTIEIRFSRRGNSPEGVSSPIAEASFPLMIPKPSK